MWENGSLCLAKVMEETYCNLHSAQLSQNPSLFSSLPAEHLS